MIVVPGPEVDVILISELGLSPTLTSPSSPTVILWTPGARTHSPIFPWRYDIQARRLHVDDDDDEQSPTKESSNFPTYATFLSHVETIVIMVVNMNMNMSNEYEYEYDK